MKHKIILILTIVLINSNSMICHAEYSLPEPLVSEGVTVINEQGSASESTFYGGFTGNEAVFNHNPNTDSVRAESVGFYRDYLSADTNSCYSSINFTQCFIKTLSSEPPFDIMNSRTSVNYQDVIEVSTLVYIKNIVQGDIYGDASTLNNFAVYGRSLNLNTARSASWNLSNYNINPESQSYYDPANSSYYNQRIDELAGEAKTLDPAAFSSSNTWYLESEGSISSPPSSATTRFPEGQIWHIASDVALTSDTYKFQGTGTIIIDGALNIPSKIKVLPKDTNSHLGIIIRGTDINGDSLRLNDKNELHAAVFAKGPIKIQSSSGSSVNVKLVGSFVASAFLMNSASNIQFLYDYNLGQHWPPGFRYFNMPVATER